MIPHLHWVSHVLITFTPINPILSSCFLVDRHIREVNLVFVRLGPLNSSESRLSLFTHTYSSWQLIRVSILIYYDMISGFLFIKAKRVFDTVKRKKFCLGNRVLRVWRPSLKWLYWWLENSQAIYLTISNKTIIAWYWKATFGILSTRYS